MNFRYTAFALTVTCALFSLPAIAAEEPPAVQAILKTWETQFKVKPTYDSLTTGADGSVVIQGLTATVPVEGANAGSGKLSVGTLTLKDMADQGNGLFRIGSADYKDISIALGAEGANVTISIPESNAQGWLVKALGPDPTPADQFRASLNIAERMSTSQITLNAAGHTITSDGFQMTWAGDAVTGSGKTEGKLANILVPESAIMQLDPSGTLKRLGYASLSFEIGGRGAVTNDGTNLGMDVDVYYAGKDIGTMRVGFAVAAVPLAVVAELQKSEPGKEPDMSKLMPQIQGIQIGRIVIRFEDASITKKVLPMIAAMQGMDEATMVANAGAMLQLGLAELRNPEFTKKAVAAVNAYLADPRSITIAARPPQPITVMQIMAFDPSKFGTIVDQLGLSITAND